MLYDVVITETCTYDDGDVPFGTFDFYMDHNSFTDYNFPLDPLDDTMMPEAFYLRNGESVTYHMVYEIPANLSSGLILVYQELDAADVLGDSFIYPLS